MDQQISGLFGKLLLYLGPVFIVVLIIKYLLPELFKALKIRKKFKVGKKWRDGKDLLYWLRGMKPSEFEHYIADLFYKLGYKTEKVGGGYDGGVDVIAEKDGTKYYIQCKKFITRKVDVHDVRDFYGALADRLSNAKGYFITTNVFTLEAEKFAEDKPIELIDGRKLIKYIRLTEKETKLSPSEEKLDMKKKCPSCGGALVERNGKHGRFLGCSNYPKCKFTKSI